MMATRVAASVNFSKILSSGVGKETGAQLVAFRKRVEDARRAHSQLSNLPDTVNLDEYRGVIKVRASSGEEEEEEEEGALSDCPLRMQCHPAPLEQTNRQNKTVLEQAERILKEFKPVTYDASQQIKTIESFEATAVRTCGSRTNL